MSAAWLRYDLDTEPVSPHLYRLLAGTADRLLAAGATADTFFVHTPDGIRLRCGTGPGAGGAADALWRETFAGAERRGWLRGWRPATHEPQPAVLGGPGTMASAMRVFTADSLAWLGYHSAAERPAPTVARWAMSVLMVRALLATAGHSRWEHADLWDRILHQGGLRSRWRARAAGDPRGPAGTVRPIADPAVHRLAVAVRAGWDEPDLLRDRLSDDQRRLLDGYESAVRPAAGDWLAAPVTGAVRRRGIALAVLFHWNRSAMPAHHRYLLATALADAPLPTLALAA
jgi:thiopeptide-type bacteriocin biosynthesis protein